MDRHRKGSLDGIVVVDLGHVYAAPYATLLLALSGALVIKVEPPSGEHLRVRSQVGGPAYAFAMLNANKKHVKLDLKNPRGVEVFERLLDHADVLVENFTPGVMARLGLDPDRLIAEHPRLVYAQCSGFGLSGPYRDYPAMDLSVQAISGAMSVTGFPDGPPVKAGVAVADFLAGSHLYGGVLQALYDRERTGRGGQVEVSMLESVYPALMSSLGAYLSTGHDDVRTGNRHNGLSVVPYNVYRTNDGYLAIVCESDDHWRALLALMGRRDLTTAPAYLRVEDRIERIDEIDDLVAAWTKDWSRHELFEQLRKAGVPAAPVRTLAEVTQDVHLHARGALHEVDHPGLGSVPLFHSPIQLGAYQRPVLKPSGALGRDNQSVLEGVLGMEPAEVQSLVDEGVI